MDFVIGIDLYPLGIKRQYCEMGNEMFGRKTTKSTCKALTIRATRTEKDITLKVSR
jgi:hypothetical protein